jgi:hypothetical protein
MESWQLIKANDGPSSPGMTYAQNVWLKVVGECGRRGGLQIASTASGATSIAPFFHPSEQFGALLLTSTGTIEKVSL